MNTTYLTYPDWMQEAVRIEREMREEIAEEARIERERQEADGRRLGRALPEALAFFDIAIPAQETNRVELDFVAFSLRNFDFEPVCHNEDGTASRYNFRLKIELLSPMFATIWNSGMKSSDAGSR